MLAQNQAFMTFNRENKNIEINKFLTLYFNNKDSFSINFLYKDTNKKRKSSFKSEICSFIVFEINESSLKF